MNVGRFDYIAPTTAAAAVTALARPGSVALAGGHHLLTLLKRRETTADRLVDLCGVRELRGIEADAAGGLRLGALTTLGELLTDPRVRAEHARGALDDAVSRLGDRQSRNRVTLGGQLVCGRVGNDLGAALMVLGATVHLTGVDGDRRVPLADLWRSGPVPDLRPGELITAVHLEPVRGASGYTRLADRATLEAVCGVAAAVVAGPDGIRECRIAAVGATARPLRLASMEASMIGAIGEIGTDGPAAPPADLEFLDDVRASADYRRHMTRVLAGRAVELARGRLGGVPPDGADDDDR